jgi:AcrR family transcriptional regulator
MSAASGTSPRSARAAEIVTTARRLLEEEGPAAVTMRRLASELGIQAPSLYKHFAGKSAVELAVVSEGLVEIGEISHAAVAEPGALGPLMALLYEYRRYCVGHPNLYRLATGRRWPRDELPDGLEEWAGKPWYLVTGDPILGQALWSFAHGVVILELDERFLPGSDPDRTLAAGGAAFLASTDGAVPPTPPESRSARVRG